MKLVRLLSRIAALSLAAAMSVGLTRMYSGSVRPPVPERGYRAAHRHRPSRPQGSSFLEFIGAGLTFAVFAAGGRIALRLRLTPTPRSEGQPILLDLHRGRRSHQSAKNPGTGAQQSAIDPA